MELDREILSAEHRDLIVLSAKLLACVRQGPSASEAISSLRWELARQLASHVCKEDMLVYPPLMNGPNRANAARAALFAEHLGGLAQQYHRYVERWPISRLSTEWPAFRQETEAVMGLLARRIAREESELYPMLWPVRSEDARVRASSAR